MSLIRVEAVQFNGDNSEDVRALNPERILGPFGTVGQQVWMTAAQKWELDSPTRVLVGDWVAKTEHGDLRVFTPAEWKKFFVPSVHVLGGIPDGR